MQDQELTDTAAIEQLTAMLKATDASSGTLLKAAAEPDGDEDGDDDDNDGDGNKGEKGKKKDEFNAEYMKKYMKRYLKESPEDAKKFMKDAGLMKAAVQEAAEPTGLDDAEMTVIDGTEMFKAFSGFTTHMLKAYDALNSKVDALMKMGAETSLIQKAAGTVLVKAATTIDTFGSQPQPVRSVQHVPAQVQANAAGTPLQKAAALGIGVLRQKLLKAATSGGTDAHQAASVLTQIESCGGNLGRLNPASQRFIESLATAV